MNRPLSALTNLLTYGAIGTTKGRDSSRGFVETLAQVYEKARNALEYRADNLVRRAAIERILKRRVLINKNPNVLAKNLLTELRWAKYLSTEEIKSEKLETLTKILTKYLAFLHSSVPSEWVIKIASAEIEELFNLNTDHKQFTFFAFQIIRQKILIEDENLDLLTYFAVDKIYAGSDDEQILFHILGLAGSETNEEKLKETWRLYNLAKNHKSLPRIIKFVRRQMPPLVLLRDIYYYEPARFKEILSNVNVFKTQAEEVLEVQLSQIADKINRAGFRSIVYVFLTKMILAFGVEVPFEILFYDKILKLPLIVNLLLPVAVMWIATTQDHLPKESEKEDLVERTWYITQNFETLKNEEDALLENKREENPSTSYWIFSGLYIVLFISVFWFIYFILGKIGFTFFSKTIFIFFLTVIAFFAYRISQIAKIYSWKGTDERSSFISIVSLPVIAIGSRLSRGLSKLNFIAFTFDFILEAPFKIILGFVDDWVQFLSLKKEDEIIE